MASAQVKGKLKFYRRVGGSGAMIPLFENNIAALAPSGSSDGTIGSTPDAWTFIPLQNTQAKNLRVNDHLVVAMVQSTAATTDASDGKVILPITYADGTGGTLGDFDNSVDWDVQQLGDTLFLANVESIIAVKKVLSPFSLGSNTQKCFISVENNA